MKCTKCGAEIKDGAKFCQACGAKQEMPIEEKRFCKACGAPLKPGAAFCTACGAKAAADLPQESSGRTDNAQTNPASTASVEQRDASQQTTAQKPIQKKKSAFPIILAVVIVLCIGIAAAIILVNLSAKPTDVKTAESTSDTTQQQQAEEIEEVNPEKIDDSDADMIAEDEVSLSGTVKISTDSRLFLEWSEPMSILLKEDDGEFVRLSDVSSAYLQNDGVDIGLWSELPLKQEVLVTGELELDGSQLILKAERMTDVNGNAIVTQAEEAASEEILPESDSRLLTQNDVDGLTLQQINYAKNEIYARHGRKFASKELQNYFDAQSWYHGTVNAADFSESVLSDVEKKNAAFLAEVEFSIAPKGYQLDQ